MTKVRKHGIPLVALLLVSVCAVGCTAEMRRARHQRRAESFLKEGNFEKAKIEYLNVLRSDPQNLAAFKAIGSMWMEQGAPLRAGPFFARAKELAPKDPEVRMKMARVFAAVGDIASAQQDVLAALQLQPDNAEALVLLADTIWRPEDLGLLEEALQKFPNKENARYQVAIASLALRKGDAPAAEAALREAQALDPKLPLAHSAMAGLQMLRRDFAKAGPEFQQAAELASARSPERLKFAEFQANAGDPAGAMEYLRGVLAQAPDLIPAWRALAQMDFAQRRNDEAMKSIQQALALDPDNPEVRLLEAQVLIAMGDAAKAVQNLQRLDKIYPKVPAIQLELARAQMLNNDLPGASAVLNQLISENPNLHDAVLLLAEINLRNGDFQAVVNAMEDLVKKAPQLPRAQLLLVDGYRGLGKLDQAVEIFRQQIADPRQSASAHLGLGIILAQQNKLEEAQAALEKALELMPSSTMAAEQLIAVQTARKDFAGALQTAQQQIEKYPNSAAMYLAKGKIHLAQEQIPEAEAALRKALELDGNLTTAYELLTAAYMATERLPEAVAELEKVVAKSPNNTPMLLMLGMTQEKMKNYEKAREAYEKLLAIKPDAAPALNNLAYLYSERLNLPQQAVETARKARTLQPTDGSVADTLGWALYRAGDYQQAIGLLQEAAGKLPDVPEVQFHLGMTAYMMGDKDLARKALGQAVAAPAEFEGKEDARQRLANIEQGGALPESVTPEDLEEALRKQPNDLVTATRLAETYERKGEPAKAVAAYEAVLKINPKLVAAAVKLVELHSGPLHNQEKALEWAKKARELAPRDPQVASVLGRVAYQNGNFTWAHSLLQESVRQSPDDATLQHQYAWAAYSLGKIREAADAMEKVASLEPDSPLAADAKTFGELVEQPSAHSLDDPAVRQRLESDPEDVPALMVRAASERKADAKAAAEIYGRILARFPDFAPAQRDLAGIYVEDPAMLTKAQELATKARKTLSDDAALSRILGEISFQRKEFAPAVQQLQQSARKQPLDPLGLYYLGMAQIGAKQQDQGLATLKKALADGLQEPQAEEARQAIAEAAAE